MCWHVHNKFNICANFVDTVAAVVDFLHKMYDNDSSFCMYDNDFLHKMYDNDFLHKMYNNDMSSAMQKCHEYIPDRKDIQAGGLWWWRQMCKSRMWM